MSALPALHQSRNLYLAKLAREAQNPPRTQVFTYKEVRNGTHFATDERGGEVAIAPLSNGALQPGEIYLGVKTGDRIFLTSRTR